MKLSFHQMYGTERTIVLEIPDQSIGPCYMIEGNNARVAFGTLDSEWSYDTILGFDNSKPELWLSEGVDKVLILDNDDSPMAEMRNVILLRTERVFDGKQHVFYDVECLTVDLHSKEKAYVVSGSSNKRNSSPAPKRRQTTNSKRKRG